MMYLGAPILTSGTVCAKVRVKMCQGSYEFMELFYLYKLLECTILLIANDSRKFSKIMDNF
jgi:hypothetical protein